MKMVSPAQLDMNNPGTWPIIYKVILWIIIVVAMLFLYNQFLRTPVLEEQAQKNQQIENLKREYAANYQYTLDLPLYQQRSEELIARLNSLLKLLPNKTEMPDLIDDVYTTAVENDINFQTFTPEKAVKQTYYDIMPIKLKAETGYVNFAKFAEKIAQLQRILNVADMKITISEQNINNLIIESQLQTYIYNQDIDALINGGVKNEKPGS